MLRTSLFQTRSLFSRLAQTSGLFIYVSYLRNMIGEELEHILKLDHMDWFNSGCTIFKVNDVLAIQCLVSILQVYLCRIHRIE